jgi:hypothetical protein
MNLTTSPWGKTVHRGTVREKPREETGKEGLRSQQVWRGNANRQEVHNRWRDYGGQEAQPLI